MSSSSPNTESIRAVSFDLGGTLIAAAPSVGAIYADVCRAHGVEVPSDRCDHSFETAWARRSSTAPPGVDSFSHSPGGEDGWWSGVVLEVLEACGVPPEKAPPVDAFRAAFASPPAWRVYDDVPRTLESLRARGYRLAILSNWDSRMPRLLQALDLARFFDVRLCSALAGMEKPHPTFFRMAAEGMGVPTSRTLHVGDLVREDYQGALAAGMSALWLDRRGNGPEPPDGVPSEHVVTSIADVARRLVRSVGAPRTSTP